MLKKTILTAALAVGMAVGPVSAMSRPVLLEAQGSFMADVMERWMKEKGLVK